MGALVGCFEFFRDGNWWAFAISGLIFLALAFVSELVNPDYFELEKQVKAERKRRRRERRSTGPG